MSRLGWPHSLLPISCLQLFALATVHASTGYIVPWPPAAQAPATQSSIRVELPAVAPGQHWALAIEPTEGSDQRFKVAAETRVPVDPVLRPQFDPSFVHPVTAGFAMEDSAYRLNRAPAPDQSLIVYLHLPVGKTLSVSYSGQVVFFGTIAGSALIVDGQTCSKSDHPELRARSLITLPLAIEEELGPDLRDATPGQPIRATTVGLRRHLLSLPPPAATLTDQALTDGGGRLAAVAVRIHIDTAGGVTEAIILSGEDPLASAAKKALEEARFKPFTANGSPVEVDGIVQYTLSDGGASLDVNIR